MIHPVSAIFDRATGIVSKSHLGLGVEDTRKKPAAVVGGKSGVAKPAGDTIHSVITSSGSGYQNFQGRIM